MGILKIMGALLTLRDVPNFDCKRSFIQWVVLGDYEIYFFVL
jgi:hypothetical protein